MIDSKSHLDSVDFWNESHNLPRLHGPPIGAPLTTALVLVIDIYFDIHFRCCAVGSGKQFHGVYPIDEQEYDVVREETYCEQ